MLYIIYALLGLAVIIAILGIINTLALSVIERTREIGLLRAVGLSRRQLKRMLRLESIVIAVLGAVLGIGLGVTFAYRPPALPQDDGIDVLLDPVGTARAVRRGIAASWASSRRVAGSTGLAARRPAGHRDRVVVLRRTCEHRRCRQA